MDNHKSSYMNNKYNYNYLCKIIFYTPSNKKTLEFVINN